ncbi:MAG: hypothetical protein Rubg2KO_16160 [Rubricoccaceae bacterium]
MKRFTLLLPLLLVIGCSDSSSDPAAETVPDVPTVEPATEEQGTLATGDETLESGEYMDAYEVLVREGQWLRAEVISGDFDPYFIILDPTGNQTDVDDSSLGNRSMTKAITQAAEGGEWRIVVTSYEPGESGDYTLTYEILDERPEDADEGQQVTPDETETESEATEEA